MKTSIFHHSCHDTYISVSKPHRVLGFKLKTPCFTPSGQVGIQSFMTVNYRNSKHISNVYKTVL